MTRIRKLVLLVCLFLDAKASSAMELPAGLVWQTQETPAAVASTQAQVGGTLVTHLNSFPLTLRQVGPESADPFRHQLDDNDFTLLTMHPNNSTWIPTLATHWALGADGRTVYYRLNPAARWSDQKPVKASDYTFTLEFMRSPHIQSPWSNEYYAHTIEDIQTFVEKDGREVIAIRLVKGGIDRLMDSNIKPLPRHFYEPLGADFVSKFNWLVAPNTGPYTVTRVEKGQRIVFTRKPDWWAKDLPFFRHRFNVDQIEFKVIRDIQAAFSYLKAGDLDLMSIISPDFWHQATSDPAFTKGWLQRLQSYNDNPRNDYALVLNQDKEPFQDRNVRKAFAHALNVDRVIHELLKDDFQRLQGISQGYGPYTLRSIRARSFDLQEADRLLKQAGWQQRNSEGILVKDGKTLTVTLVYGQSNLTPRLVLLQEDARKAGFDLRLQQAEAAAAQRSYRDKNHQIAFMAWTTHYHPEYRSRLHSSLAHKAGNANLSNTSDPALDALIEAYESANEETIKIAKAHAIQQYVFDEACYIPLFEIPYYRLAFASWIHFPDPPGTRISDGASFFDASVGGLLWMDTAEQKSVQAARRADEKLPERTWLDETYRGKVP